jgi:hypothetical protein
MHPHKRFAFYGDVGFRTYEITKPFSSINASLFMELFGCALYKKKKNNIFASELANVVFLFLMHGLVISCF